MPTALDIDVTLDDFSIILDDLASKPALFKQDIERLRSALIQQGGVDRRRAAEIFHTNRIMQASSGDWSEFYLENLTLFFLNYRDGRHVLPAESESLLLTWLGNGVSIDHANERRLAFRIFLRATETPERIEHRILKAVRVNLLDQSERWLGIGQRSAGEIDALDMQMIRRLAYGAAGEYPIENSRAIIDFLLDLDQQISNFTDPDDWRQLLVDCITRHLSVDQLDEVSETSSSDSKFEVRMSSLFDGRCSSEKAIGLHDDVRAAMQVIAEENEETTLICR